MSEIKKVLLGCLSLTLLYNIFFFQVSLGIAFGILISLINLYFFFIKNDSKYLNLGIFCSFLAILFSFLYAFRANEVVRIIDFGVALFFSLTALFFYKNEGIFRLRLPDFLLIPIETILKSIEGLITLSKPDDKDSSIESSTSSIIKGFIIAIPVFIILLLLLILADPAFGKLANNFLTSIGERLLLSFIIFVALLSFGLIKLREKFFEEKLDLELVKGKSHELLVILVSITVLFTAFILVQFKYLFSNVGERELAQLGIQSLTYSEYINKGFFELLVSTVIASCVILYVLRYIHKLKGYEKLLTQFFASLVTLETGLILLSDVKRLFLYASEHGLTRARIFGFIFLVWLCVFLLILLYRILQKKEEKWNLFVCLLTSLIATLAINFVNVDGLIADKYKPTVNGEVDYYYLTSLSTDSVSIWSEALNDSENQIKSLEQKQDLTPEDSRKIYWTKSTLYQLSKKVNYLNKYGSNSKWQEYNFSEDFAYQIIKENSVFNKLHDLLNRINILDSRITESVRSITPIDRVTNPPF